MQCNVMQTPYLSRSNKYCIIQLNPFVIVSYGLVKLLYQLGLFIERITARLGLCLHVFETLHTEYVACYGVRTEIISN